MRHLNAEESGKRAGTRARAWLAAACLAMPALAAPKEPGGFSVLAGISHQWAPGKEEDGQTLHLGGGFLFGPHSLEARLGWLFHPALRYMTSVDRIAALSYGRSVGMGLRPGIGFGLYRDYREPGIPVSLRWETSHAALEAYCVGKRRAILGASLLLRTGKLR